MRWFGGVSVGIYGVSGYTSLAVPGETMAYIVEAKDCKRVSKRDLLLRNQVYGDLRLHPKRSTRSGAPEDDSQDLRPSTAHASEWKGWKGWYVVSGWYVVVEP